MNISDFIQQHIDPIVDEWVEFAQTRMSPFQGFTRSELADHAKVLLLTIAADMKQSQGEQAKHDKAQGNKPDNAPKLTRVAGNHAEQRFDQGFSVDDLLSEFRALRASVIRRWTRDVQKPRVQASVMTAADRMKGMVKDILDFTQTAFGVALPITPAPADFGDITTNIVGEISALHPDTRIELTCAADLAGRWDAARVGQMLANLLANATQHGAPGEPVIVIVDGDTEAVRVQVSNAGPPIPQEARDNLFSPLRQKPLAEGERRVGSSGLGLGLYITREIAVAHGGTVDMSSGVEGTTFTVRLPRTPPVAADRRARALGPATDGT